MPGAAPAKPAITRTCKCGCGQTFTTKRLWQEFLSTEHRQSYWRKVYTAAERLVLEADNSSEA